jgi:hypothetical protein
MFSYFWVSTVHFYLKLRASLETLLFFKGSYFFKENELFFVEKIEITYAPFRSLELNFNLIIVI